MDLIRIAKSNGYIHIQNIDLDILSINNILVKKLVYHNLTNSVILINADDHTIELNYTKIEDPNSPDNSFDSLDDLWDWLMIALDTYIPPPVNAVTHLTIVVTHNIEIVTHT